MECRKIKLLFLLMLTILTACETPGARRLKETPTHVWLTNMASLYFDEGKYDEAIDYAKRALKNEPNYPHAWYWLGVGYENKDLWDDAIHAFKRRIELAPPNDSSEQYQDTYKRLSRVKKEKTDNELHRANKAIGEKNYTVAITLLKRTLTHYEDREGLLSWTNIAGILKSELCDPDEVIIMTEKSFKFYTDDIRRVMLLSWAYAIKGDAAGIRRVRGGIGYIGIGLSSSEYESTVKVTRPGQPEVVLQIKPGDVVVTNVSQNTPAEKAGLQAGDRIIHVGGVPVKDTRLTIKLIAQNEPGSQLTVRVRRGEQVLDKILTVGSFLDSNTSYPLPYPSACRAQELNREGVAFAKEGKNIAALTKFEEAIQTSPGPFPKAHYNAALVLEQMGRLKEAMAHYVKAYDSFILPDDEMEALNRLVALTQKARVPVPETADRRYRVGIVRTQQKRYKEAIQEFEAALAEAPWIVEPYYNLGLVYDFEKEYSQALRVLRIYVRLAPNAPNISSVKSKIVELEDKLELHGKTAK